MLLNKKQLKLSIISTGIILLSGCATIYSDAAIDSDVVTIERQGSRTANIAQVAVYQLKDGSLVRGKVQRSHFGRSKIPGHVDIELLSASGKPMYKDTTSYQSISLRSRSAKFSVKLDMPIEKGSLLRIKHHDSAHRADCAMEKSNG